MRKAYLPGLLICLLLFALVSAQAQEGKPEPTVTLNVTDAPATEVAAELSKQLGYTVAVLPCEAKVTLELKEAKADEAVKAFAAAIKASWLRAYFLQPKATNYVYTPEQYLQGLTSQREAWLSGFTDEQRQQMMRSWFGGFGRGRGGPGGGPGAAGGNDGGAPPAEGAPAPEAAGPQYTREQLAAMPGAGRSELTQRRFGRGGPGGPDGQNGQPAPQGQPAEGAPAAGAPPQGGPAGAQNGQQRRGMMDDPVGQLIIPVRTETFSLEVGDAEVCDALYAFTTASGFIAVPSTDLAGKVTLKLEQAPIKEALDKIAAAVDGKWQPIYLLGVPRELSEAEMEQRMEQGFQNRWAQFWAKPKEDREKDIQGMVDRIQRFTQMRGQGGNNGQQDPNRAARMRNRGERMLSRMQRYSASLSMDQRRELLPLIRAMGSAVHQQ